jgi:HK97 family phage prohead protease
MQRLVTLGDAVVGYAVPFGQNALIRQDGSSFLESVSPDAVQGLLGNSAERDRVRIQYAHGKDGLLGSRPVAVPTDLRADNYGLRVEARFFEGSLAERELAGPLAAKQMGMSIGFSVLDESWVDRPGRSESNPRGLPVREIRDLILHEISLTERPAYKGAVAGLQAASQPEAAKASVAPSKSPYHLPEYTGPTYTPLP